MANGVTIIPNGQTLVVTALGSNVFYTDTGLSSAVTLPAVITADTAWYCSAANAGANTFTIAQPDGTVLWSAEPVFVGTTNDTQLRPMPTLAQLAADTGTVSYVRSRALDTGIDVIPRPFVGATATMTSGTIRFTYFKPSRTFKVTSIRTCANINYSGGTPSICRVGIYTVAANGTVTLAASSTNDTSMWSAGQAYDKALTTPYTVQAGTEYAVAALCVTAGTTCGLAAASLNAALCLNYTPTISSSLAGQTDLAASAGFGGLSGSGAFPYFALI